MGLQQKNATSVAFFFGVRCSILDTHSSPFQPNDLLLNDTLEQLVFGVCKSDGGSVSIGRKESWL